MSGGSQQQQQSQRPQSLSGGRQQQPQQQQPTGSASSGGGSGCDQLRNQLCCDMGFMAELVSTKGKAEMAAVLSKQVWNGVLGG